ncbi:hydrophobin family protein [Aspergillus candidus]|uniref:Hydrophobin n=1 Tax=Aspergillus candidus TaxID=41067 RepID=A0A2I2F534_ASPCN|nr:fungal hydrophobin [Aspergillus candidus]PLB35755.1 fungal hydrophobin [Aspergillus candidus]
MKFSIASGIALLAATAAALPQPKDIADDIQNGNGIGNKGNSQVRFPVPDDLTVEQASAKCGDKAQLSCCNKATYTGDSTKVNDGLLSGALSELLGAGSGSEGLGLFNQCSKLPLQIPVIAIGLQDALNQKCKQNIACCQDSPADASESLVGLALPCVALGSIL